MGNITSHISLQAKVDLSREIFCALPPLVLTVRAQAIIPLLMIKTMNQKDKVDLETDLSVRKKRLQYRCWHRGSREADLLLGRFADKNLPIFGETDLNQFEALLNEADPDIWDWVVGRKPIPAMLDHDIMERLKIFSSQLKKK